MAEAKKKVMGLEDLKDLLEALNEAAEELVRSLERIGEYLQS